MKAANVSMLPEQDMTPHHTRVPYAFTDKGYMTNDLFKLVMAELRRVIKLRHRGSARARGPGTTFAPVWPSGSHLAQTLS